ncbi:acyl carrier protein [Serratia fonticola]|jgi:acyl carrier protein|uniref:acyl carrier protein n=1 Tax=Serratia fonticola TaxID=47917 RepID=UPI000FB8FA04|nr:acyl carrier protein [Serratia fonticola]CAI1602601.1 Phosphopantetheine attachment site [Serratia fonticola]CAI2026870.1 Phosphopantetheine attachment site [Serratia fonticola]HBE9180751.1 acyl carrier protein [Serratia fonticola]
MTKIISIFCNVFGVPADDITETKSLSDLRFDSISIIDLQIEIERTFELKSETLGLVSEDTLQTIVTKIKDIEHEK